MANPTTPNLGLKKIDRSSPATTTFNTKPIIDDNMDILDTAIAGKAPINNPIFTGTGVTLPANPTDPMHATTRQWVEAEIAKAKKYAP
ncbi:hypothetical protein [Bacillus sp. 3255]|uniref:hypothetical protein n=1 Tax=Bacillus sp. 3255 TaxID=2817904 RepID=UPI0028550D6D|nr:hypothetical protein [Bacillus sp. 3255]MDR6883013.1 hypothetical protein [Bacillus sp. 3255]